MNERVVPNAPETPSPGELAQVPSQPPTPAKRANFTKSWVVVGLLASMLLATAFAIAWWFLRSNGNVQYTTAPMARRAVIRTVTATGVGNPELTIIVGSYVSGVIQQIHCDYNTQVKTGQICAEIDPRPYQTTVDQAKANLAVAKAQLEKAIKFPPNFLGLGGAS